MSGRRTAPKSRHSSATTRIAVALLVVALFASVVVPFAASAQSETTVDGTVTDVDTGTSIQGANVTAWNGETQVATDTTGEHGQYSVSADNITRVEVTTDGYDGQSRSIEGSSTEDFQLGSTPRYAFTLPAGDAYALGVPGPVEADTVGDLFDPFQGVIYGYDSTDGWHQVGHGNSLRSLQALVVVVDADAEDVQVTMTFNGTAGVDDGTPPERDLESGWNFVSPPQSDADAAFSEAEEILDQGYAEPQSQQVEGEDAFTRETLGNSNLRVNPFKGYFVHDDGDATVQAVAHEGITRTEADGGLALGSGSLEGTVTNETGHPIADATVNVSGAGETTTDADGNYSFGSVPAGLNTVTVEADGYVPAARDVAVRVNELATGDVTTVEQPTIEGRVTDAELAEDDGIENATVVVEREADDGSREVVRSAETNATGHYGVHVPRNDTYNVSVEAPDHDDESNRSVDVGQADVTGVDFALNPRNATVVGNVTDVKTGDPIEGAEVTVTDANGTTVGAYTTAANGSYVVTDVEPHQEYDVSVAAENHSDESSDRFTLGANETRTEHLALDPLDGSIEGAVIDGKIEEPIEGAEVTATDANGTEIDNDTSATDGSYRLEGVPTNEEVTVAVTAPDHVDVDRTLTLDANESRTGVAFPLSPEDAVVDGTLTDNRTGEPVPDGVPVTVESLNSSFTDTVTTAADGTYSVAVPAHESYDVTAGGDGRYVPETNGSVAVGAGDDYAGGGETVDFSLVPENGAISGTVTDSNSSDAIAGATVAVGSLNSSFTATAETDSDGAYNVTVPGQESYELTFNHTDYAAANETVDVGPGEDVTLDVALDPLGHLRGVVFADNGSSTEKRAGATVTLYQDGAVVTSVQTDADGSYQTEQVAAGTYVARADDDGFTPDEHTVEITDGGAVQDFVITENGSISGTLEDAVLAESGEPAAIENATVTVEGVDVEFNATIETDQNGSYEATDLPTEFDYVVDASNADHFPETTTITLGAGEDNVTDFALEPRNATIAGSVSDNETGEGVGNATITVESTETDTFGNPVFTAQTETAADGSYELEVEPHSEYTVDVAADDHEDPATRTVEVGAGESYRGGSTTVDFDLRPLNGSITGTVTDAKNGDTIGGAAVTVTDADGNSVGSLTTGTDGSYAVEGLEPHQEYTVWINATDHFDPGPAAVTLDPNETNVTDFELDPKPATISGTLNDSQTGEPIENATVEAVSSDSDFIGTATTDANGEFTIEDVPAHETYDVVGNDPDYQEPAPDDENQRATVDPGANGTVEGVALELDPKPATVFGTVTDAELEEDPDREAGIEGVDVTVFEEGALGTEINSTTTGENGDYALEVPADGTTYVVEFGAANHTDATGASFTPDANADVERNASLDPLDGVIEGMVTDNKTGDPVDATVAIQDENGDWRSRSTGQSVSEDDGEYVFQDVNASQEWTIVVLAENYEDGEAQRFLSANGNVVQDFALDPKDGSINGTVADAESGDPIGNATVVAVDVEDPSTEFTATTDADGTYAMNVTSPATYNVTVEARDHENAERQVEVGSAETVTADFDLTALPGEVSGTVTSNTTGDPIAGVEATVVSEETDTFGDPVFEATVNTSDAGEYHVDDVPANANYTVEFAAADYADETTAVFEVGPNASVERSRTLDPLDGTISGNVTDAKTGDPIGDATVEATNASEGVTLQATTAADGSYAVENVPADLTYEVQVTGAANHSTPSAVNETVVEPNEDVTAVDFELEPSPATIEGTVTNASDSSDTLADVTLTVERLDDQGNAVEEVGNETTGTDGTYSIGGLDAHEEYRVTAETTKDYLPKNATVSVGANETVTQDFALEPSGYVTGVVRNASDLTERIEGANVTIIVPGGTFGEDEVVAQTTTDQNGEYTTEAIETGDYEIQFDADGYTAEQRSITVGQGENVEDAELQPE